MVCLSDPEGSSAISETRSKHQQRLLTTWLFNCRCPECTQGKEMDEDDCADLSSILPRRKSDEGLLCYSQHAQRCSILSQIACGSVPTQEKKFLPEPGRIMYPCISSLAQLAAMITDRIRELPARGNGPTEPREDPVMRCLLDHYEPDPAEVARLALFEPSKLYTRNLVAASDDFDLILLCWNPGKQSPIHDHSGSHCHMKVIQGEIFEDLYAPGDPAGGAAAAAAPPRLVRRAAMPRGHVGYAHDARGLHAVGNPSADAPAVSLHLYRPPIRACRAFPPGGGPGVTRKICFHSVAGRLVDPAGPAA